VRIALKLRISLKDDPILVAWTVEYRNLALPECVVERGVDVLDTHAHAGGRNAVGKDIDLESAALAIGGDVGQLRQHAQRVVHTWRPLRHFLIVGAPYRILV
jgi:hypothetical protein